MKTEILNTLEYSKKLIISPDMDGFMSAKLINRFNGSQVVGTYDKNILLLADGIDPEECLFVDCDMNREGFVSIGNHMRMLKDGMSSKSFNPNVHFGISTYTDKFPFATAFLISFATEVQTSDSDKVCMAFADSTLRNMEKYGENMRVWSKRMEHDAVSYIVDYTEKTIGVDNIFREEFPNQSFASKRFGKVRYMDTLNEALKVQQIPHQSLISAKKYLSDRVGQNTVIRYNQDIISYAEIFTNEYSVTYDQEVSW